MMGMFEIFKNKYESFNVEYCCSIDFKIVFVLYVLILLISGRIFIFLDIGIIGVFNLLIIFFCVFNCIIVIW